MANKKTTGLTGPEAAEAQAPKEYVEIGQLRAKHNISRAVYAGVCAAQDWKPGKAVTEAEFLAAVRAFTSAPMRGGTTNKEAKK
jgi:hypothetical protein